MVGSVRVGFSRVGGVGWVGVGMGCEGGLCVCLVCSWG
jgi:hypothetical protein